MNSAKKRDVRRGGRSESPPQPSKVRLKNFLDRAMELAGPVLDGLGLELVTAQCRLEGGRPVLRLFIDRRWIPESGPAAKGSEISLDDCVAASRAVEAALEADNQGEQPEGYVLEVSSPGLDRPLLKEDDFRRFQGRLAKVRLRRAGEDGGKSSLVHKGRLSLAPDGSPALQTAEGLVSFSFQEVVSARLSLDDIAAARDADEL